ncbi:MAG: undecaprenyldiphospho-muramoylpentapeptide beta-N-acetylglucosaminyltransferase [Clostridia bacterium]|nr:undecaprenyldiphospho-muramoylpentapeptide beta-N-acetylglucosaminyltransferase [Clostridia bacterium]
MKILIAAGGTGGHINPGIAIGKMLSAKGNQVKFVGTNIGMEKDLVPKAGFELEMVHSEGLHRGLSLKNIKTMMTLNQGVVDCKALIKKEKPDLVIGTGGYVTAPLMIAGLKLKVPTMIHESNALPGKTTIWLSKSVDVVALGFEDAKRHIPNAKNAVFTGNPTSMNIAISKDEMKKKLGINGKLLLVFGGSQGAKKINDTMVELINDNKLTGYEVIYATGNSNYDEVVSNVKIKNKNIKIEKYIYNMNEVMKAADLVVCRSGALTVTEIAIVGVPSILIPFPYAAENHQFYNAKTLEDVGAGIVIEEKNLTKDILEEKINEVMKNDRKINEMSNNAKKIGDNQALERIEKTINSLMGKKKK